MRRSERRATVSNIEKECMLRYDLREPRRPAWASQARTRVAVVVAGAVRPLLSRTALHRVALSRRKYDLPLRRRVLWDRSATLARGLDRPPTGEYPLKSRGRRRGPLLRRRLALRQARNPESEVERRRTPLAGRAATRRNRRAFRREGREAALRAASVHHQLPSSKPAEYQRPVRTRVPLP